MEDNFKGYYMKCNGCTFQNPSFKRGGFKCAPRLIQVTDSGQVASGKLTMKVLPHVRSKIWCSFPPMTPEQFRVYCDALEMQNTGKSMYLTIEFFDEQTNQYLTDTFYHNDIVYTPINYNGQRMIEVDDFELIGH